MSFDFAPYLEELEPSQAYEIERLTGGLVNCTVRATKDSVSKGGRFSQRQSVVLKYAPPFVAAIGEKAPFSQSRQDVEAAALSFLAQRLGNLSDLDPSVLLPELLYYDEESHVIVISDLGILPNLNDFLETDLKSSLSSTSAKELGCCIGKFFAKLHSVTTYNSALAYRQKFDEGEKHSRELITQIAVTPVEGYLQRFGVGDASELQRRIKVDFDQSYKSSIRCFILGDSWPGALLIKMESPISVGFIDWEFAGFGRGVHGDIAQMLAHLLLHLYAQNLTDEEKESVTALTTAVMTSYRREAKAQGEQWAIESVFTSDPNSASKAMRSTAMLLGREMINNAVERDWKCRCCPVKWTDSCLVRRDMISKGIWYLRSAEEDDAKFCKSTNHILDKDWVLRALFTGN